MVIFDLYIEQGSTFNQVLQLGEDLTGYTVTGNLKDREGLIVVGIVSFTNIATGEISIDLTAVQTATLSAGVGYYDIELTKTADGSVSKPIKGRIYTSGEVTI